MERLPSGRRGGRPPRYFAAGADVVLTNTLGGTAKLAHHGLSAVAGSSTPPAPGWRRRCATASPRWLVAGDIGPAARSSSRWALRPTSCVTCSPSRRGSPRRRCRVLVVETMFDLAETPGGGGAARSADPAGARFDDLRRPRGYRTMMGVDPRSGWPSPLEARALTAAAATATRAAIRWWSWVGRARAATDPVLSPAQCRPASARGRETIYDETPKHFAADAPRGAGRQPGRRLLRHIAHAHLGAGAALGRSVGPSSVALTEGAGRGRLARPLTRPGRPRARGRCAA